MPRGHGTGIFILALTGGVPEVSFAGVVATILSVEGGMPLAVTLLVLSHGVSFLRNFIRRGEYRTLTVQKLMMQPYARIMVMHGTLIGGAFLVTVVGANQALLAAMVLLKTVADARQHLREHRATAAPPRTDPTPQRDGAARGGRTARAA